MVEHILKRLFIHRNIVVIDFSVAFDPITSNDIKFILTADNYLC